MKATKRIVGYVEGIYQLGISIQTKVTISWEDIHTLIALVILMTRSQFLGMCLMNATT